MHPIYKTAGFMCMLFCGFTLHAQEGLFVSAGTTVTVTNNAEITTVGTITSANGSTWINRGIIRLVNNGSWIDQTTGGGYQYGTGKFIFTGTGSQSLNSLNTFSRIDVDGSGIQMLSDIRCNKWYLTKGIINTGSFVAMVNNSSDINAIEADPANTGFTQSWFNGRLIRSINPSVVNTYLFPVGNGMGVNQAVLGNLNANPLSGVGQVEVSFGPKPGNDAGLLVSEGAAYVSVNSTGVWYISFNATPASGSYDLLLYFNGFPGLNDNNFGILQRPLNSSDAAEWAMPAGSVLPVANGPGRTVAGGYARRNNISTFGQFGIGMSTAALPVTLVNFKAIRTDKTSVQLDWQTASEQNNKGFDVERRYQDEINFRNMGFVASKAPGGNSTNNLSYNYTDANNYSGISYYRLKQTDLDNRRIYTLIKAVKGTGDQSVTVLLWPNPSKGQFSIRVGGNNQALQAIITDMNGSIVQRVTIQQNRDVTINGLVSGAYIIRIPNAFGNGESFTEKVLVVK